MNANNRRIQHYAGLVQVSTSVFILGDALAMTLLGAWGCDTGVPYICATSSFLAGLLALRCSVTPTPTLRRLSHALSFMNLGVIYGVGMVLLGTFGFLLDHKRHSPGTLLSVHMAYTLFGLINIICAIMQVKSVSLRPAVCLGDYSEYGEPDPPVVSERAQRWCTCGLSDYSLVSDHSSHIVTDPSYPSQLHVFCTDYSPTFVIDAEILPRDMTSNGAAMTSPSRGLVTSESRDFRPTATPPPPYEEVVGGAWDDLPSYREDVEIRARSNDQQQQQQFNPTTPLDPPTPLYPPDRISPPTPLEPPRALTPQFPIFPNDSPLSPPTPLRAPTPLNPPSPLERTIPLAPPSPLVPPSPLYPRRRSDSPYPRDMHGSADDMHKDPSLFRQEDEDDDETHDESRGSRNSRDKASHRSKPDSSRR